MKLQDVREALGEEGNWTLVPKGWRSLVLELCEAIEKLHPDIEVTQVKEKWGGLRFYVMQTSDEVHELINAAERESEQTCQDCGSQIDVKQDYDGGWLKTLCSKCDE